VSGRQDWLALVYRVYMEQHAVLDFDFLWRASRGCRMVKVVLNKV
jgi:hypothetical protein